MSQVIALNAYIGIFLALIIGGETVLLPALYLAVSDTLFSLPVVFLISLFATIVADLILYVLGRSISSQSLFSHPFFSKYRERMASLSSLFQSHALLILFSSKFVYGTRSLVQILCGRHHVPFIKYFSVNILAITLLNVIYVLAAMGVYRGVSEWSTDTPALIAAFVVFVGITMLFQVLFKKFIWQKLFQQ